jgi:hypothetical protein
MKDIFDTPFAKIRQTSNISTSTQNDKKRLPIFKKNNLVNLSSKINSSMFNEFHGSF